MSVPPSEGRPAAFFDVDHTLLVGTSLETCFVRQAIRERLIGPAALVCNLVVGLQALGWLPARERPFPIPAGLAWRTHLRYALFSGNKVYLRGLEVARCREVAEAAFRAEVLPRLSRQGEALVREHRAAGRPVFLLSGTLDFLAEPLRAHLGADGLIAARPEVEAGRFTGRLREAHPYGERKRDLLRQVAREAGLDLARSYAYADHHTDIPFLESVGHPVAVNPDERLAQVARERGWRVEQF